MVINVGRLGDRSSKKLVEKWAVMTALAVKLLNIYQVGHQKTPQMFR
jgi:hypothetical protein